MSSHEDITNITRALGIKLGTLTGFAVNDKTVAWPNKAFSPPADNKYLKVDDMPSEPFQVTMGDTSESRWSGIYQVSVFWPAGQGTNEVRNLAARVARLFKMKEPLIEGVTIVRISRPPWLGRLQQSDTKVMIPVSVPYFSDLPN